MESRQITLNFLPLENERFTCRVYRRRRERDDESRPADGMRFERFIEPNGDAVTHWLSLDPHEGFEPCDINSADHPAAATWVLTTDLPARLAELLPEHVIVRDQRVGSSFDIVLASHPEGAQVINCEVQWRWQCRRHGLLLDFRFRAEEEAAFSKRIQQLSLSLDEQGRSNRNFYRDKFDWMDSFVVTRLRRHASVIRTAHIQDDIRFSANYEQVDSRTLDKRVYAFGQGKTHTSQYWGIERNGVLQPVAEQPTIFFVFRRRDIGAARFLYRCLQGEEFPERFRGMEKFFALTFNNRTVQHIEVDDLSPECYQRVVANITAAKTPNPLCIVVTDGSADTYYAQKAIFLQGKIPSQDVTVDKLAMGKNFQWAVAGIGLQVFCKAGGLPWKVNTQRQDALIVGLSQVWDKTADGVERYVAYSVLTDSSGLFHDIETLVDAHRADDYVRTLGLRIREALGRYAENRDIRRVVLHCSFRLKHDAMNAVRNAVQDASESFKHVQFVVMRVSTQHSYFGYDTGFASCVPYECSYVRLGHRDYLAWFEGAGWDKPVVVGRVARPIRITFDYPRDLRIEEEQELLQDLANLSGANWRGFNAKATPVSVFYCDLVGEFVKEFSLRGLPVPALKEFKPWFL